MRTAGLTMSDVWADRILRERGVETLRCEGLPVELGVLVDTVELQHHDKNTNYRPYLHVTGELRSITPAETLPYGISQVTYAAGQGEKVDAFYEFDDQQMVVLASKGYFGSNFTVPEQITGIEWELPAAVDVLILAPSGAGTDAPVVFTRAHDIAKLEIDLASSGYDLTDYFADHPGDEIGRNGRNVDERELRARAEAISTLFPEDDIEDLAGQTQQAAQIGSTALHASAADEVSTGLRTVEAQLAAERERVRNEREQTEGTPENLYRDRVALDLQPDEEPSAPRSPDGANAGPGGVPGLDRTHGDSATRASGPAPDERRREIARRTDDLDFGDDEQLGS